MINYTDQTWSIDGLDLTNFAFGIEEINSGLPASRGKNLVIPQRRGELWQPKELGPATIQLGMWIRNTATDGTEPSNLNEARNNINSNIAKLLKVFGNKSRQLYITRNVWLDGSLITLNARAEVTSTLPIKKSSWAFVKFTVALYMADPCWYANQVNIPLTLGPGVINNPGNQEVIDSILRFNGPLTGPSVSLIGTTTSIGYSGVINAGNYVEIDTHNATVLLNGVTNVVGNLSKSGGSDWLPLASGDNSFVFSASSGEGSATLLFNPPYIL